MSGTSPISLATFTPYYFAGVRVDGSGSIADTIAAIMPHLAQPPDSGTLVSTDIHGGLIELGEGVLSPSLAHVLERLAARRWSSSPRHAPRRAEEAATVICGRRRPARRHRGAPGRCACQDPGRAGAPVPSPRGPPDGAS